MTYFLVILGNVLVLCSYQFRAIQHLSVGHRHIELSTGRVWSVFFSVFSIVFFLMLTSFFINLLSFLSGKGCPAWTASTLTNTLTVLGDIVDKLQYSYRLESVYIPTSYGRLMMSQHILTLHLSFFRSMGFHEGSFI